MNTITAPERLRTRSGLEIQIRPATTFDEPVLEEFFEQVTDEDRRFRFFGSAHHLGHAQLDPLVEVDHFRSESFLAFETEEGELVATAQLACDNALDTAEVAVSVRRDFKGRGIGWTLLDVLAREAERRGVRQVQSLEDRRNAGAIALEREKGFEAVPVEGDPTLVLLSKTLR